VVNFLPTIFESYDRQACIFSNAFCGNSAITFALNAFHYTLHLNIGALAAVPQTVYCFWCFSCI